MPSFTFPGGASADDIVHWPWAIVVESEGCEIVRWRRYLAASRSLNAEAEIELGGSDDPRRAKEEAEGKGPEAPWNGGDSERLLAVLVDDGEITERDRETVLATRAATGKTVERALIEREWVDERDLFAIYADLTGTEFVDLSACSIDPAAASLIPEEIALRYGLIAIGFRGDDLLIVAMSDPQHPRAGLEIEAATWRRVYIVVATRQDVLGAIEAVLGPSRALAELSA
jgi:type IV pilus assembly protein PilB